MALLRILTVTLIGIFCLAARATEYEEVSYDDLVSRLNTKKSRMQNPVSNPLDDIKIHAGFGMITGLQTLNINGQSHSRALTGFQIALGVDLFSANWSAEAVLRNQSNSADASLRETDVKILYRDWMNRDLSYTLGTGLTTRDFKYFENGQSTQLIGTPSAIAALGIHSRVSAVVSLGFELSFRPTLVSQTPDRWGTDGAFRMDAAF